VGAAASAGGLVGPPLVQRRPAGTGREVVEHYQAAGSQRLPWWGRPDPTKHFAPAAAFIIPSSLLWGGFSIFWEVGAARSGAPLPFVLFGAPFVAVGLFFVFGQFIAKARRKRQTAYGLTDRRALVAGGTGSLSESPLQYQPINVQRSRDGSHVSVTFGRSAIGRRGGPATRILDWSSSTGATSRSGFTTSATLRAWKERCSKPGG